MEKIRFIDLFAGIGGMRKGLELACADLGLGAQCVFTSEIKEHAISALRQNYPGEAIFGDITKARAADIPDFDILLAGFPCQAFSSAGKRLGFEDTRGTLFFDIARILKAKRPSGFILENVEGLVRHDRPSRSDPIGRTLKTILDTLEGLGYKVSWKVLNARRFSVPQERKRVYIAGTLGQGLSLSAFPAQAEPCLAPLLERGLPCINSKFTSLVLAHYDIRDLPGKSFKDKRGGPDNIHSWDIELKGPVSERERALLSAMVTERRKKKWAEDYGIDWMDGMPLTYGHIASFYPDGNLQEMLDDLVEKGYLKMEYPKRKIGNRRIQDSSLPLGYNIVTGKMSFAINKILDPGGVAPTLVAMDMERLFVVDSTGLRNLSLREGLRLFGYPESYSLDVPLKLGYDLLGNTVAVPVIKAVALRLLGALGDAA